jgi:CubicO group peptidase (beta-lactamase class C family)
LELLILQSAGKLSLDDSPIKYIPCLKISKQITLEMLGSQLSGLTRDATGEIFRDSEDPVADTQPMLLCSKGDAQCSPEKFVKNLGDEIPLFPPETQTACIHPTKRH